MKRGLVTVEWNWERPCIDELWIEFKEVTSFGPFLLVTALRLILSRGDMCTGTMLLLEL